ncbi:MAG: hypothetical protein AB1831_06575 [Pseudomonadota bacterium]
MSQIIPETTPDYDKTRIVERPDGFFWLDKTSGELFGPFATLLEAVQDMQYEPETDYEPVESLEEAEQELGIADWVDADTGELAEDTITRLEDH